MRPKPSVTSAPPLSPAEHRPDPCQVPSDGDGPRVSGFTWGNPQNTINSGVQVLVLLFGDCAFSWYRLCGVLIIIPHYIIYNKNDWLKSMGYIVS